MINKLHILLHYISTAKDYAAQNEMAMTSFKT
jgi:hypothetical protein